MAKSRKTKTALRLARIAFSTLSIAVLSILIVSSRSHPRLLDHAKRVFQPPSGFYVERNYKWIGPHEVIAVVEDLNKLHDNRKVARFRTDTGQMSFLQHNNAKMADLIDCSFSPDGHWYLCNTSEERKNSFYLCATDDSNCQCVYTDHSDSVASDPFVWLSDSQHWISMPGFTTDPVQLRDGFHPDGKILSLQEPTEDSMVELSADKRHVPIRTWFGEETRTSIPFRLYNPDSSEAPIKMKVPTPVEGRVMDMIVSPSGENLAWVILVRNPTPFLDKILKRVPFIHKHDSNDTYQLWTTRFDGSRPKLLGVKDVRIYWDKGTGCFGPGWMHDGGFQNSAWTQDEQALSFIYKDSMYVVDNK